MLLFPQRVEAVFAALYHAFFVLLQPVHTPEGLRSVLVAVLGENDTNKVVNEVVAPPRAYLGES